MAPPRLMMLTNHAAYDNMIPPRSIADVTHAYDTLVGLLSFLRCRHDDANQPPFIAAAIKHTRRHDATLMAQRYYACERK